MSTMDFTFGEGDQNVSNKVERYKGEAGNTDRVSFVWWDSPESPAPKFRGCRRFYIQNVGYVRDNGPEFAKIAGGPSKLQIVTLVAVWPTDKSGSLRRRDGKIDTGILSDVVVKPWVFSADKYEALKRRHQEFPFNEHDINMACTDSNFQKMDFSACKESLYAKFRNADSELAKSITSKIHAQVEHLVPRLESILAQDLTLDQLREKLGLSTGDLGGGATADLEVDGMLDDLLDD